MLKKPEAADSIEAVHHPAEVVKGFPGSPIHSQGPRKSKWKAGEDRIGKMVIAATLLAVHTVKRDYARRKGLLVAWAC